MTAPVRDLDLRRATDADLPAVLALLAATLSWERDTRHEALFAWKHRNNAFGASPAWVAYDGDRLAGFRALMRWEFERGGRVLRAVRAVDTATDAAYQGRGIFTKLTLLALDELRDEIDFVFNTPNDQSRPGYLKMGWVLVGRLPVFARPVSVGGLVRMARARTPAELWSLPSAAGERAADVLAQRDDLAALIDSRPVADRVRTRLTPEVLAWRYGLALHNYRAVVAPGGLREGVAFFRLRRRGSASEAACSLVLAANDDRRVRARLAAKVAKVSKADYAVSVGNAPGATFMRVPGDNGPTLTWRAVRQTTAPTLDEWALTLGDIELF
ncbi:MAG: Acetyltransferase domain [Actinomycetia bacterium]|nr:Acetyltransferase domain [Actinomycetes bacterium]